MKHYFGQVTHTVQCRIIIWVMACDGSLSHKGAVDLDSKQSNPWGAQFCQGRVGRVEKS